MNDGIFGGMFDFNNDGALSAFEKAAEFQFLHRMVTEEETDGRLAAAGLSREELRWMDEDERRETLEDAGIDPADFEDAF